MKAIVMRMRENFPGGWQAVELVRDPVKKSVMHVLLLHRQGNRLALFRRGQPLKMLFHSQAAFLNCDYHEQDESITLTTYDHQQITISLEQYFSSLQQGRFDEEASDRFSYGLPVLIAVLMLSLICHIVPIVNIAAHSLVTVVHECGHTVAAWLFGYPAIPVFVGIQPRTIMFERPLLLMVVYLAVLGWWMYRYWQLHHSYSYRMLAGVAIYLFFFFSPELTHRLLGIMGHGGEILGGWFCCYFALMPDTKMQNAQKMALLFLGMLCWVAVLIFVWRLGFDPVFLDAYFNRMDGSDNDLALLSLETGLSMRFFQWLLVGLTLSAAVSLRYALEHHSDNVIERFWLETKTMLWP